MKKLAMLCVLAVAGTAAASAQVYTFAVAGVSTEPGTVSFRLARREMCGEDFVVSIDGSEDGQGKAAKIREAVDSKVSACGQWRTVSSGEEEDYGFKFQYYSQYYSEWRDVAVVLDWQDTSGGYLALATTHPGAVLGFRSGSVTWEVTLFGGSSSFFPVDGATLSVTSPVAGSGLIDR